MVTALTGALLTMSINQQTQDRIAQIKKSLENNHAGNPLMLADAVEIDQVGLADTHFDSYNPEVDRYTYVKIGRHTLQGILHVYPDGSGVFRCRTYERLDPVTWPTSDPNARSGLGRIKIRFWRFGCQHNYRDMTGEERRKHNITLGRCEHANVCVHCGHVWVYDSSD